MVDIWAFTEDAMRKLADDHMRLAGMVDALQQDVAAGIQRLDESAGGSIYFVAKTTSIITAISSDVVGTGTADTYFRVTSDNTLSAIPGGANYTIYNSCAEIASGTWIGIQQDPSGDWWAVVENCP